MGEIYGGVETGGTWVVCALGSGPQELVRTETFRTEAPGPTIERIVAFFAAGPAPVAVGVGSFGPLDLDAASPTWGHVTTTPKPGWAHTAVAPVLQQRLGVPVVFDTDVNAAAVGEQTWGAGRGHDSVCYLTIGTGIGAGLVIDGRTVHGLIHPEVGHLRIPHDRTRDPFDGACPVHGDCWEGLAAGPAIAGRWATPPQDLPDDHPAWELEAEYVALGLLAIVSTVSPHRIIVAGGVMERPGLRAATALRLSAQINGYLQSSMLDERIHEYVVAPALGDNAGVLGAIELARRAASG